MKRKTKSRNESESTNRSPESPHPRKFLTLTLIAVLLFSSFAVLFSGTVGGKSVGENELMTSTSEIATITDAGDNTHPRWSQDGNYLLVPSKDSNIYIYERGSYDSPYKSFSTTANIGHHWDVYSNPAEDKVVVAGRDMAKIYDFDGNVLKDMSESMGVFGSVCWTPDGDHVMIANQDEQLVVDVWDVSDPDPANWNLVRKSMIGLSGDYSAFTIDVTKDGNYMAVYQPSIGGDTTRVWDISDPDPANWVEEYVFSDASQPQFGMGLRRHPDSNRLLVPNCSGGDAYVYDLSDGSLVDSVNIAEGSARGGAFSPNGDYIVVGQSDTGDDIEIYDTATFTLQETLTNHTGGLRRIDFTPDGELMCSGGADSTVRVWDTSSWAQVEEEGISVSQPTTDKSTYGLGEEVNMSFNATHPDTRANISRTYLSLQDPTGTDRIDNASTLEFQDQFEDGKHSDKWNTTSAEYSESSGKLKFGYSGTEYKERILVNGSRLQDKKDLNAKMDFNVLTDAEHTSRIIAHYQDSNNYVALYVSHYYSAFGIEEVSGGTRYNTETSKPITTNTEYELRFTIQDGTAKGYLNGEQIISRDLQYTTSSGRTGISTDASEVEYDNYTIGYPDSTLTQIEKGYQSNYTYTVPNNASLGGTWTITAKADNLTGSTSTNTNTFTVVSDKPYLQNQTILGTSDYAGDQRRLRIYATHSTPPRIEYQQNDDNSSERNGYGE